MKITNVKTYALRTKLDTPFAFSQGWVRERGRQPWSRSRPTPASPAGARRCARGCEPPEIAAAVIRSSLAPLVTGRDPRDVEVLWHRMYAHDARLRS